MKVEFPLSKMLGIKSEAQSYAEILPQKEKCMHVHTHGEDAAFIVTIRYLGPATVVV